MADIFLSYARADLAAAQRIAARLREFGFSVWFDESLPAHRAFSEVIEEQLEAAHAVVVLWSKDAVGSQWVRSEANRGRERGRLVQLRLDDARLPLPFDQIQCADLSHGDAGADSPAWRCVMGSIAELTGRSDANDEIVQPARPLAPVATRRRHFLMAGAAAAAAAGAGFAGWRLLDRPKMSPQAQLLLQKGMDALQQNDAFETQDPGSTLAAIALLTDATEAAPGSAIAWGALSMAYVARWRVVPAAERPGLESRSRAAANTALKLDPGEGRALGALRMLEPSYRNWMSAERAAREALSKSPRFPILLFVMSDLLGNVGRWREATQFSSKLDRTKFLIPGADRKVLINLWATENLPAADKALETAVSQWPQHAQIFRTRIAYLMYTGRPAEALEILGRKSELPLEIRPEFIAAISTTAEALAGRRTPGEAVKAALAYLRDNPNSALQVALACVALGDASTAYALFDGYYFGEGPWAELTPLGGDQDRITNSLFLPPMRPIWKEARFDRLLERIGLNAYWRQSGTKPDFRA